KWSLSDSRANVFSRWRHVEKFTENLPCRAVFRLGSVVFRRFGRREAKLCLKFGDSRRQFLVLGTRLQRDLAHRIELFALDNVHRVQDALRLTAKRGLDFTTNALRRTCGIGHQLGEFVQNTVWSGRHGWPRIGTAQVQVVACTQECKAGYTTSTTLALRRCGAHMVV